MKKALILALLFFPALAIAGNMHPEKWYQDQWCGEHGGQTEVVLADNTRVDCVTEASAIEFDFAHKWYEALGQALYYSVQTGKRAGIVLILEGEKDQKYLLRLNSTIEHLGLPIDVWKM